MYFYDLAFDDDKIVFSEYLAGQIVVLNDDFTVNTTIYNESHYGALFWGVYVKPEEYIFSIYQSKIIKKYIKKSKSFVDVKIKDLPKESMVCFKHDEVFLQKDKVIIVTYDNEILVSDLKFSEVKYVKRICRGKPHMQIAEDDEFLYIPIEKTIYRLSKGELEISVYAQLKQTIDILFRNREGLWSLTNDARLAHLYAGGQSIDLSRYIHFYGNKEDGQIYKYINAYCYKEKVLFIPCYCDKLLLFDVMSNQIIEIAAEKEIENEKTLNREQRKNIQKYIASCQKDRQVFLLSSSSEILYVFNFDTLLLTECPKGINGCSLIKIELEHGKILREQPSGIDLSDYIEYIANK